MWTRYFSSSSSSEDSNSKKWPQIGGMLARYTQEDFRARFGNTDNKKDQTPAMVPRVVMAKSVLARNRAKMEAEFREKGLSTELDDSNKGFAMLQKMGYKKGAKRFLILLHILLKSFNF